MVRIILGIEGMKCPKCEAHMNEAIKKGLKVKSVSSSHTENKTVILAKHSPAEQTLRDIVTHAGFTLTDIKTEEAEKKLDK